MMDYEMFSTYVKERTPQLIPDNYHCDIHPVKKGNDTVKEGLCILPNDIPNGRTICTPIIYIENMYEAYKGTGSGEIDSIINDTISYLLKDESIDMNKQVALQSVAEVLAGNADNRIIFDLINTDANKEFLETVPSRKMQDLSIIYKLYINKAENGGFMSITITNGLQDRLGLSENELYQLAQKNTKEILPIEVKSIFDTLKESSYGYMIPDIQVSKDEEMYIITNKEKTNGAVNMLYTDTLDQVADRFDSDDIYIIPSSIHEVIAVSKEVVERQGSVQEMSDFIHFVNADNVSEEERLSNQLYHYDKTTKELSIVSDSNLNRDIKECDNVIDFDNGTRKHRSR